jgi:hypothetical protein
VVSTSSGRLSRLEASRSVRCDKAGDCGQPQQIVRGEHDENVERLPFQASEVYAIWQALKPAEAAAARERRLAGLRRCDGDPVRENFPDWKEQRVPDRIGRRRRPPSKAGCWLTRAWRNSAKRWATCSPRYRPN